MAKTFLDKNNKKLFEVYETKEIVANPVLSGGEASLTSFQVGETKYKIDGGGGGGTEYTAGYGIDITNDVISIEPSEVAQKVTVTDIKLLDDEDCFALNPGDIVLEEETISSENPIQAKQYTPYTVSYKFTGSGSDSYTFAELALTNAEAQQIKTVIYNYDGTQSVGSQWSYIETIVTTLNTNDITSLSNDQCDSLKIGDKVLERTATEDDVVNTLYSVSNYTEDEYLNLKTLELVSVNKSQISTVTYQKNITPSRGINDWVYIDTQVFSVSANPVSTTETLNSIEINGTNYAIAGGGTSVIANKFLHSSDIRLFSLEINGVNYNALNVREFPGPFDVQSGYDLLYKDYLGGEANEGDTFVAYIRQIHYSRPVRTLCTILSKTVESGNIIMVIDSLAWAGLDNSFEPDNTIGKIRFTLTIQVGTFDFVSCTSEYISGGSGMDITAQEIEEYFDEYCDIQAEVTEETIEGEDVNVLNLENVDLENEAEYLGLDLNASNVSAANKILDIE